MSAPVDRLRYLTEADVLAAMPPVAERLALAERTMTALVGDAELPPKIGVHPRPPGSFAHAMPAWLRGTGESDSDGPGVADMLGIKWVTGFPANRGAGVPAIHAVVVLSDPSTGRPTAIVDGGPITAQRTAAVSGVAIRRFGPFADGRDPGRPVRAAIIGAGVQGLSHLEVLGHVLPGVHLTIHDRDRTRAEQLAVSAGSTAGIGAGRVAEDAPAATLDADVVVSAASFTDPAHRQVMDGSWLGPDALVVPIDYATMLAASVARDAALFLVDEVGQFLANRASGEFDGYPDPAMSLGAAILARTERPAHGRVVVTHLGVGLADVIFADAIVRRATEAGLGVELPR